MSTYVHTGQHYTCGMEVYISFESQGMWGLVNLATGMVTYSAPKDKFLAMLDADSNIGLRKVSMSEAADAMARKAASRRD